jgi:nucleotide-binding universal stress UspA family protein
MYTDIIIGFDGSPAGHDALALGRRLALTTGASTTVVCVHPHQPPTANVTAGAAVALSGRTGAERALDQARRTMDDVPDVRFHAKAETSPARALREAAMEAAAAVIVIGSTHRRGLARAAGTTADRIICAAPCAVAVAPVGYADRGEPSLLGAVGAAVDGGSETERVARVAARIARGARARLRLLVVVGHEGAAPSTRANPLGSPLRTAVRRNADRVLDRAVAAAGPDADVQRRVVEGPPATTIVAAANDLDLLVVGSRGRGPLRRVMFGTVGGAVLRDAGCPVLAIPRRVPEQLDVSIAAVAQGAAH